MIEGPDVQSWAELEAKVPANGFDEIPYSRLGWRLFIAVMIIVAVVIGALIVFAAMTYPRLEDVRSLVRGTPDPPLKAWREARAEWVDQFTAVAQAVLYGSLIPLLATIVGYVLGDRTSSGRD